MLDEAAHVIKGLFSGEPVSYLGDHYRLQAAQNLPAPPPRLAIIMGGKGERTLQVVACHAGEWNCSYVGVDVFREKSRRLDEHCRTLGRDPATLRRSIMIPFVIGRDEVRLQARIDAQRRIFPGLPADLGAWRAAGFIGGSPQAVMDQLAAFVDAGAQRFMLQHNDLDDLDALQLLAETILPHFHEEAP
jgi:alkanesulfonate monooxygenase SsuD/methylene tetrahydromethanopterin reductase-like flavin-dependent oxidoreductase (luciferase family)